MELTLREIQNETLEIMKVIDKICKENNYRYVLYYGTLIGAIRHKGFIPWDDDLDILMPRRDYNQLANYFIEHEKELEPLKLFSKNTIKNYPYYINRICNTCFRMEAENEIDCGMGTFIDIYPVDGIGNGKHWFTYLRARLFSTMYFMKRQIRFVKPKNPIVCSLKFILKFVSNLYSIDSLYKHLDKIANKFDYDKSEYIGTVSWAFTKTDMFRHEDIEETVNSEFEGLNFSIPKNYDYLLRRQYGNYMEMPSEDDRIGHHFYKIFRK